MTSVSRKAVSKINYEPVKESVLASDVLIAFGILGYITVLLFNGVLMHVGLSLPILEAVRPFLPEFFLVFSIFGWLMNKQKVGKSLLISLVYFLIVMILSFGNFTVPSLLITLRNFLIPYFAMLLLSSCSSSRESFIRFNKSLLIIFSIFIVVGCGFSIIQQIRGWEWMSTYFQGYSSWGTSGNVRVVWSSYETLRTLGTTWYRCPEGHLYVVGECGGPMQESRCPECGKKIGGRDHVPANRNVVANLNFDMRNVINDNRIQNPLLNQDQEALNNMNQQHNNNQQHHMDGDIRQLIENNPEMNNYFNNNN